MRRFLSESSYKLKYPNYNKFFKNIKSNVYNELENIEKKQIFDLKKILIYAEGNTDYYSQLFKENDFKPSNLTTISDLGQLPITTKEHMKNHLQSFFTKEERKFQWSSTGGSTGSPLKYKLDFECSMYARAVNDRGWGYGGYRPGNKVLIFAGGSLVNNVNYKKKFVHFLANFHSISSYGINNESLNEVIKYINREKPDHIYAYVSSLYFLALHIEENNIVIKHKLKSVFVTAEQLFPHQREKISKMLNTEVFDAYGLNDGGVSAHECEGHNGLHIDMERSLLEVVDDNNNRISEGEGRIIATSFHNYSMPFIRYDTGDRGYITQEPCNCGKTTPRLLKITGRVTDYLKFNDTYIGSPVLTVLMGNLDISLYQIIQENEFEVLFKIVLRKDQPREYKEYCEKFIRDSFDAKVPGIIVKFDFYYDFLDLKQENKHKFIINNAKNA